MNAFKSIFIEERKFKQRDKVKVINGPFNNFFSTIDSIKENKRIWVFIDLMGGLRRANVLHNEITPT